MMASRATSRWRAKGIVVAAGVLGADGYALAGADLELGRYLAAECMACHRAQSDASSIPNLSRLSRLHIVEVVKAYRAKELPNPAMQNVAGRLSDDDIESLALYFSTTKQP